MGKQLATDDGPIHELLRGLGYKYCGSYGDATAKSEFKWKLPSGGIRRLKYQKRSGKCGPNGRYRVGIAYNRFDEVDDFVFWAEGEKYFLIVPSSELQATLEANKWARKNDRQWVVNICFDRGGRQTLRPVWGEDHEDISQFAHRVS